MVPKDGDVLISNPTATVEHVVSIVPDKPDICCPNQDAAVARGQDLAKDRQVDAWLTEDHTHFVKIASYRPGGGPLSPAHDAAGVHPAEVELVKQSHAGK